jgi:hypothetical protein
MLYVMIDNLCVLFAGRVFLQTVGMPMGINCYPLLAYLSLHSYQCRITDYWAEDTIKSMLIYLSDASVMIIHVYLFRKSCLILVL